MEQAKGKARVYVGKYTETMQNIVKSNDAGKDDGFALGQFIFSNYDFKGDADYCQVGEAEITINFFQEEKITTAQVESLQEQLRKHRINSQKVENHILDSISKLQSIGFSGKIDGVVVEDDDGIPF
jgi:hypothetical protein